MNRNLRAKLGLAMVGLSIQAVLFSDIFIRGHHIKGTSPASWDLWGTVFMIIGLFMLSTAFWQKDAQPLDTSYAVNDNKRLRELVCVLFMHSDWAHTTRSMTEAQRDLWADVLDERNRDWNVANLLSDGDPDMEFKPMARWWKS